MKTTEPDDFGLVNFCGECDELIEDTAVIYNNNLCHEQCAFNAKVVDGVFSELVDRAEKAMNIADTKEWDSNDLN